MASTAINAQGTIFQIGTGTGGAKNITAVAIGNPTIITSTAHGLNNGDRGAIASITGTVGTSLLNGNSYSVMFRTTNTFAVAADSAGLAYTSGGTFTPTTYTAVGNVRSFQGFDGQASEIDVTNFASTAKEFRLGLVDNGNISFEIDLDNADAGQVACRSAMVGALLKDMKLILPSGSTPTASFQGFVRQFSVSGGVDDVVKASIQVRISGAVTWA